MIVSVFLKTHFLRNMQIFLGRGYGTVQPRYDNHSHVNPFFYDPIDAVTVG